MRFEQFSDKHRNLNIKRDEIVRKWKILMQEEEERRLFESARRLQGQSTTPPMIGGGNISTSLQSQFLVYEELEHQHLHIMYLIIMMVL